MALKQLEIETYELERGEYYVAGSDIGEALESWHRIFLLSKPDTNGIQKRVEMQFASDRYLENYISSGVGFASDSENRVLVRFPLSEFEQTYNVLRSEKPIFFQYDQFADPSDPEYMRVHTVRLTTSREETGEGPRDLTRVGGLVQEAEEGERFGAFLIGTHEASSSQYVYVPNGTGNRHGAPDEAHKVKYTFHLAEDGTYRIKGLVYAANPQDDSFWVKVNDAPSGGYLWDIARYSEYGEDYVNHRGGADPVEVTLAAGLNTVTVYLREDGTRLGRLELELTNEQPVIE